MERQRVSGWGVASRLGILIGFVALAVGLVLRHVRSADYVQADYLSLGIIVGGGLVALGCLVVNYRMVLAVFTGRRTAEGINFGVVVVLALGLAAMLCFISTRRFTRIDWTRLDATTGLRKNELHSRTRNILRGLEVDVDLVIVYYQSDDPLRRHNLELWRMSTREMLDEFHALSTHVSIEEVDWSMPEGLARVEELGLELGESSFPEACVLFTAPDAHQIVPWDVTAHVGPTGEMVAFAGEDAFASALIKLIENEKTVLYALTGHGERPLEGKRPPSYSPYEPPPPQEAASMADDPSQSLSRLVKELGQDNYEVTPLDLAVEGRVPDDCAVLLIAGPESPLSDEELAAIEDYLDVRQGSAVVMVESGVSPGVDSNLGELLEGYGIRARTDAMGMALVRDMFGRVMTSAVVPVTPEGMADHAVTQDLPGRRISFAQACPLEIVQPRPQPMLGARVVVEGPEHSWGETELDIESEEAPEYDPGRDAPQPVTLAVVVEPSVPQQPGMPPPSPDMLPAGPKLLVLGGSASFANFAADQTSNTILVLNAVNWMAGKTHMLGIPAKDVQVRRVDATRSQILVGRYVFIGGLPFCIIALGFAVWLMRRR